MRSNPSFDGSPVSDAIEAPDLAEVSINPSHLAVNAIAFSTPQSITPSVTPMTQAAANSVTASQSPSEPS